MNTVTNTRIWKMTLAHQPSVDPDLNSREKLRTSFISFREHAAHLAAEIHRDLPEFTVHDITHLDALWEIADIIGGSELSLTPAEAFVLGGAILLHDLGMSLASYPNGIQELKQRQAWKDTIALQFMEKHDRQPTEEELSNPPKDAIMTATAYLLRALHAEQAENLGMASWTVSDGNNSPQYLIQDTDIRQAYGRIIGLVAHSHWWSIEELEKNFNRVLGAPHWCPKDWTVDLLKVACLLRLADAGHIDARRAPYFLRAIRHIADNSAKHWIFQQKLGKPHLTGDALSYTSGYAFPFTESASWWLCFDTLRMIDGELRSVDTLLADKGIQRFAAKRIAGIESPERLISYIPTAGWVPVDASVQVSDVPKLLASLGGKELYGRDLTVPLRELIQNASDAVRARRVIENRAADWGNISVHLGKDGDQYWLEVEDTGVGMSISVLTKYLLDFSTTFWGSSAMIDEFPGLLGSSFRPTGKYGIGFFSIFMLGNSVQVRTRRSDAAQKDTLVLEFNTGLSSRPILREALHDEILRDGGTVIKVWLHTAPDEKGGLLYQYNQARSLVDICHQIAPALPVNLICKHNNTEIQCVRGNDWIKCTGTEFFERIINEQNFGEKINYKIRDKFLKKAAKNLRIIYDSNNQPIGRACICNDKYASQRSLRLGGVVTVGGLTSCSLNGIAGVLNGKTERAARDIAIPVVSTDALSKWATEQASLISNLYSNPSEQMNCAEIIRRCGGQTCALPIAKYQGEYVSSENISTMALPDKIYIIDPYQVSDFEKLNEFRVAPYIFVTEIRSWKSILQASLQTSLYTRWPENDLSKNAFMINTLGGCVIEFIAISWGCSLDDLKNQLIDYKEQKMTIGYLREEEIKGEGIVLKKPRA